MYNIEKYVSSKILITLLTDYFEMTFQEIKEKVNACDVLLKEEEIKQFIKRKQDTFLKNQNNHQSNLINFENKLIQKNYRYEPYTYEYFKKHINILKEKTNKLLFIFEKIATNKNNDIELLKQIRNLDIELYNEQILKEDVVRLIEPTIYNIEQLIQMNDQANDLNTYLIFKVINPKTHKMDIKEEDLYPNSDLQSRDLDNQNGYVPLSQNQKQRIKEKEILYKGVKVFAI